jgi:tetratricopeptide (TPR) repeat protein
MDSSIQDDSQLTPKPKGTLDSIVNNSNSNSEKENNIWDWITFFALALIVYFIMELWYRWLRPNPEFLNFSTDIVTIFTIASFLGLQSKGGKKLVLSFERLPFINNIFLNHKKKTIFIWSIVIFLALLLYVVSPQAAVVFRKRGVTALENGSYSNSIKYFTQALSLTKGDARTYYDLASAQEALHNYDQAIIDYHLSLENDDSFWPTYNNLGRLYILSKNDPDAALGILINGQKQTIDQLGSAIIHKNIGWAYLEKGFLQASISNLDQALDEFHILLNKGDNIATYLSEAHRLKALAYESLEMSVDARQEWQDSYAYALTMYESDQCNSEVSFIPMICLDATRLLAEAREKIND